MSKPDYATVKRLEELIPTGERVRSLVCPNCRAVLCPAEKPPKKPKAGRKDTPASEDK